MIQSQTYRKLKEKKAFEHLADSSTDIIDYRARLCYISMRKKHPSWNRTIVKALAEQKAMFVTIFQKPLEKHLERKMKAKLKRNK